MPTLAFRHGSHLLLLALLGGLCGLLPGQVNPASAETTGAKRTALIRTGLSQVGVTTMYDPAYVKLDYPGGDVPMERGVCTDVVIRALRGVKVDLQMLVHTDIKKNRSAYPREWGNIPPDPNIDHRRVPNLMTFFRREGKQQPVTQGATDYLPGDFVVWRLPSGLLHIGLVTDQVVPGTKRPLVVHNIGAGAQVEDVLFEFKIIGHFRWFL